METACPRRPGGLQAALPRWEAMTVRIRVMSAVGLMLLGVAGTARAENLEQLPAGDAAHGKYIFQLASCAGCHGSNLGGFRAGGPPELPQSAPFGENFAGPFGSVPARNISQDRETGIGGWTDQQIAEAIRNGRNSRGEQLFPIMPYLTYHGMSDQDLADLVAFLRTVPATSNRVPDRQLNGPVPPLPPLPPSPAAAPAGSGVARGAYLVGGVVLCGDCHTPMTDQGGPDMSRQLAGGLVPREGGRFEVAPNITPDQSTGIGRWSEADIIQLLKTGQRPGGGRGVGGLMRLVI